MARSVAVTGTAGMIGSNAGLRLVRSGFHVVGLDRSPPNPDLPFDQVIADVNDPDSLMNVIKEHRVEAVVHGAAISGPMVGSQDPALLFEVNVRGTHTVLEVARQTGVMRVIFLSSIAAYGGRSDPDPVSENGPLLATDSYGASKAAAEAVVRSYGQTQQLETVSLRLAVVYGPGRLTACPIRDTLLAARRGEEHHVPYGRGWKRQYIFVEDVAEAVETALDAGELPRDSYNIASGDWRTMDAISRDITAAVPGARLFLDGDGHPHDYPIGPLATQAAANDLGFRARTGIIEGVRRYWEWLAGRE